MTVDLVRNPVFQLLNRPGNEDLDTWLIFTEADTRPHYAGKVHPLWSERLLNFFDGSHNSRLQRRVIASFSRSRTGRECDHRHEREKSWIPYDLSSAAVALRTEQALTKNVHARSAPFGTMRLLGLRFSHRNRGPVAITIRVVVVVRRRSIRHVILHASVPLPYTPATHRALTIRACDAVPGSGNGPRP